MSTALEADYYRARSQNRKKMAHDPRTNKPFEATADLAPVSDRAWPYIPLPVCSIEYYNSSFCYFFKAKISF